MESSTDTSAKRGLIVLAGAFLLLAPVAVYARLGTVVVLVLTLAAQPCFERTMVALRGLSQSLVVRLGAALALWAAISLLWTPEPSVINLVRDAIVPVMGLLLISAVRNLPDEETQRLAHLTMISGLVMLALLAMEVFSHGALVRLVVPDPGPIPPEQTSPVFEAASHGAAVMAPLAFGFAYLVYARSGRAVLGVLYALAALVVCRFTSMDASWVAIAAGVLAFAVTRFAPRFALVGFFAGLMLYAVLAPVISTYVLTLDGLGMPDTTWVGSYTRIGIWHEASRLIAEQPIWGHGFDSTRVLSKASALIPGTPYPALPLHTHNGLLQIWLELGGVGILLTSAILAAALRALWALTAKPVQLALVLATLASTTVIALISFGIWQHWWLATWMLAAGVSQLALKAPVARA